MNETKRLIETYIPTQDLLQDRVVLVTGASSGIGRSVAKAYATYGATVILLARSVQKLENLYDEIQEAGYPTPVILPFNLENATPNDYQEMAQNIETQFGRLDGLLHNAATLGSLTPIELYPIQQWYQVLQVNLHSAFLLTQALLPLLKAAPESSLLFTHANEGLQGKAYWGAYGVSKFGIQGLMQILAEELEVNTPIRVNSINPGQVRTPLRNNAYPAEKADTLVKPEMILALYLYLMGPDCDKISGQNFECIAT